MIININQIYEDKLGAIDGDIGHVKDLYFDDLSWKIRYIVADTGPWLMDRQVLISPEFLTRPPIEQRNASNNILPVKLTRRQIEDSPRIDEHRPVSRHFEEEYFTYYGWPAYWHCGGGGTSLGLPMTTDNTASGPPPDCSRSPADDPNLRSTKAVTGYKVHAIGGMVGIVRSFMVDDKTWKIRDLAIEATSAGAVKDILLLPTDIEGISFINSTVFIQLSISDIRRTREYNIAVHGVLH